MWVRRWTTVVLVGALVVGLVALLASWSSEHPPPASAAVPPTDAGVPTQLEAPPSYLSARRDDGWWHGIVGSDLAVGPAAAAFPASYAGPLVLVGASDGVYHLVDLPDPGPGALPTVALAPDGRRLAFSTAGGIAVADLTSGAWDVVVPGVVQSLLAWSPDGRVLAWRTRVSAGLVDGDRRRSVRLPPQRRPTELTVADDGTVASFHGDAVVVARPHRPSRDYPVRGFGLAHARISLAPDARRVVVTTGLTTVVLDLPSGRQHALDLPRTTAPRFAGWLGDGRTVVQSDARHLSLVDTVAGRRRVVAVVPGGRALDVAVGLMSVDRPVLPRDAPEWPASVVTRVLRLEWLLLGLVPAGAVAWRAWRPGRSRSEGPSALRWLGLFLAGIVGAAVLAALVLPRLLFLELDQGPGDPTSVGPAVLGLAVATAAVSLPLMSGRASRPAGIGVLLGVVPASMGVVALIAIAGSGG